MLRHIPPIPILILEPCTSKPLLGTRFLFLYIGVGICVISRGCYGHHHWCLRQLKIDLEVWMEVNIVESSRNDKNKGRALSVRLKIFLILAASDDFQVRVFVALQLAAINGILVITNGRC